MRFISDTKLKLGLLSAVSMWEFFSYYGMRALLVLYMTKALLFSHDQAYAYYGAYGTFVYITPLLGAMIAERYLGLFTSILLGGALMVLGHVCLAFSSEATFFNALAFIIMGNGLIKPNLVKSVGQLFPSDSPERRAAFTYFYVGSNLGSFLSPILCGVVAVTFGWQWGFLLAGFGMFLGLILYVLFRSLFFPAATAGICLKKLLTSSILILLGVYLFNQLISWLFVQNAYALVSNVMLVVVVGLFAWIVFNADAANRKRLLHVGLIFFLGTFFWALNQQAGSSITLYTDQLIDRHILGWEIPTAAFQSVNPIVIIIFGPMLAMLWSGLKRQQRDLSFVMKMTLSILLVGVGFGILAFSANLYVNSAQLVSWAWLFMAYFMLTIGELCCEPIALEACNVLPKSSQIGMMIGLWYLITGSYANYLASLIARLTSVQDGLSLLSQAQLDQTVFAHIAQVSLVLGIITLAGYSLYKMRWLSKSQA